MAFHRTHTGRQMGRGFPEGHVEDDAEAEPGSTGKVFSSLSSVCPGSGDRAARAPGLSQALAMLSPYPALLRPGSAGLKASLGRHPAVLPPLCSGVPQATTGDAEGTGSWSW